MTKPVTQMSSRVRPTSARGLAMDAVFTAAQPYIADAIEGYVAPALGKVHSF